MSKRHYADFCKEKLGMSQQFEEGFNAGYEYALKTIKPQVVKEYVQDPVTVMQDTSLWNAAEVATLRNSVDPIMEQYKAQPNNVRCGHGVHASAYCRECENAARAIVNIQGASNL